MKLDELNQAIQKAIGADRREQESWFQFFDRLNKEGRLDLRAVIYSMAVMLDYTEANRVPEPFLPIDTRPETPKKEATKPKKKSK